MKTQHTPSPWKASEIGDYNDNGGDCRVVLGDDRRIAVVHVSRIDLEGEANARLIAASPELLAALQLMRAEFNGPMTASQLEAHQFARAAIAKATG